MIIKLSAVRLASWISSD